MVVSSKDIEEKKEQDVKECAPDEIQRYVDIDKLADSFINLRSYMGRQMAMTKAHGEQLPELKAFYDAKYAFRSGILDIHKRAMIMKYFNLKPTKCFIDYKILKKALGPDFVNFTSSLHIGEKSLYYDYLTEQGCHELDFMLVYFMRNMNVERVQFCSHLVNILLIFMPPWEVLAVMQKLIQNSN